MVDLSSSQTVNVYQAKHKQFDPVLLTNKNSGFTSLNQPLSDYLAGSNC